MVDDDDDSLAELMALDRLSAGHGAQERRANPAPRVNPLDKPKEIARKWKAAQLQKQNVIVEARIRKTQGVINSKLKVPEGIVRRGCGAFTQKQLESIDQENRRLLDRMYAPRVASSESDHLDSLRATQERSKALAKEARDRELRRKNKEAGARLRKVTAHVDASWEPRLNTKSKPSAQGSSCSAGSRRGSVGGGSVGSSSNCGSNSSRGSSLGGGSKSVASAADMGNFRRLLADRSLALLRKRQLEQRLDKQRIWEAEQEEEAAYELE